MAAAGRICNRKTTYQHFNGVSFLMKEVKILFVSMLN